MCWDTEQVSPQSVRVTIVVLTLLSSVLYGNIEMRCYMFTLTVLIYIELPHYTIFLVYIVYLVSCGCG